MEGLSLRFQCGGSWNFHGKGLRGLQSMVNGCGFGVKDFCFETIDGFM